MWSKSASAFVAFALGAVTAASSATAADMPTKAPRISMPPAYSWTGFYGGISIGYVDGEVTRGTPSDPLTANLKPQSFVFTVLGGYDYQFANNIVIGARVAVPFYSLTHSAPGPGTVTYRAEVKQAFIVAGRVGYSFGQWLPYFIGGGVWAKGRGETVGIVSAEASHTGYILGGGVEYRLNQNWSIDANITHISMDKQTYTPPAPGTPAVHGFDSNNFTVGANYRF